MINYLFLLQVSIPNLEWLELSSIHIQKIWSDQSLHCFQNLLTLNVTDCGNLKYLLSLSMAGCLVNLQSLFVSGCDMMEDIFRTDDARVCILIQLNFILNTFLLYNCMNAKVLYLIT